MGAGHNISPRLEKQLVLKLEVRVVVAELLEQLPSCIVNGQAVPLDEDVPNIMTKLSTRHLGRGRKEAAIQGGWQRSRSRRSITTVGLQQAHMEDIMQPCPFRKL
jgi:hypothetical protein